MKIVLAMLAALSLAFVTTAHAQQPQRYGLPNGNYVPGAVTMCLDTNNVATPAVGGACGAQQKPIIVQQQGAVRTTQCAPNPLTHITPPLC